MHPHCSHIEQSLHLVRKCIFLGYKHGVKGAVLLDLSNREIFISRNITHHEHILPYKSSSPLSTWTYHPTPSTLHHQNNTPLPIHQPTPPSTPKIEPTSPTTIHPKPTEAGITDSESTQNPTAPDIAETATEHIRRSQRQRHPPLHLSEYVCSLSSSSVDTITSCISYPISSFHSFSNLSPSHHAYSLSVTHNSEPHTYLEASKHECWNNAMKFELDALERNGTWILVDLPENVKPIGNKWVYKVKYRADGSIERYKARLVAKGYNQVEGLDFFDTFSPVAKLTTVRTLLAIASAHSWHLHQLDVNNAFLHGDFT